MSSPTTTAATAPVPPPRRRRRRERRPLPPKPGAGDANDEDSEPEPFYSKLAGPRANGSVASLDSVEQFQAVSLLYLYPCTRLIIGFYLGAHLGRVLDGVSLMTLLLPSGVVIIFNFRV